MSYYIREGKGKKIKKKEKKMTDLLNIKKPTYNECLEIGNKILPKRKLYTKKDVDVVFPELHKYGLIASTSLAKKVVKIVALENDSDYSQYVASRVKII